jgi:hypothetical protein
LIASTILVVVRVLGIIVIGRRGLWLPSPLLLGRLDGGGLVARDRVNDLFLRYSSGN